MKKNIPIGLAMLLVASLANASELSSSLYPYAYLGMPYDAQKIELKNFKCVDGIEVQRGNTAGELEYYRNLNAEQLAQKHGGYVDGDVQLQLVNVAAGGYAYHELASDKYSDSFTLINKITPRKRILDSNSNGEYTLTEACKNYVIQAPGNTTQKVGDEFVQEIEYGANLLVNMRVDYFDEVTREEAGGYLKVNYAKILGVEGKLDDLSEDTRSKVRVTLTAIQQGGQAIKLLDIIPDGLMSCSFNNITPCVQTFNKAVAYARQLDNQLVTLDDYAVTSIRTESYENAFISDLLALDYKISQSNLDTRMEINRRLDEEFTSRVRANNLLSNFAEYLTKNNETSIRDTRSKANYNIRLLSDFSDYCAKKIEGNQCSTYYEEHKKDIKKYDLSQNVLIDDVRDILNIDVGSYSYEFSPFTSQFLIDYSFDESKFVCLDYDKSTRDTERLFREEIKKYENLKNAEFVPLYYMSYSEELNIVNNFDFFSWREEGLGDGTTDLSHIEKQELANFRDNLLKKSAGPMMVHNKLTNSNADSYNKKQDGSWTVRDSFSADVYCIDKSTIFSSKPIIYQLEVENEIDFERPSF